MEIMRLAVLLAGIVMAALPSAARAETPDCGVPADLVEDEPRLPELAERLRQKHPVTIVVIGGATTAGAAAGNAAETAYPHRLQDALRRRHPEVPITVVNKGVSRQTTQEMVDRFARDVYALAPTLVIWETGTFDAAHGVDVDLFSGALETGLGELHERRLDTMLMNMQYSRSTASVINFEPYLAAMQRTADVADVYLFRRFEMMKYWSENGIFNFANVPPERRAPLAAAVYECIAERLADAIDFAIK
jgi:lysophospholipase L1-like esterase